MGYLVRFPRKYRTEAERDCYRKYVDTTQELAEVYSLCYERRLSDILCNAMRRGITERSFLAEIGVTGAQADRIRESF